VFIDGAQSCIVGQSNGGGEADPPAPADVKRTPGMLPAARLSDRSRSGSKPPVLLPNCAALQGINEFRDSRDWPTARWDRTSVTPRAKPESAARNRVSDYQEGLGD